MSRRREGEGSPDPSICMFPLLDLTGLVLRARKGEERVFCCNRAFLNLCQSEKEEGGRASSHHEERGGDRVCHRNRCQQRWVSRKLFKCGRHWQLLVSLRWSTTGICCAASA